MQFHAPGGHWVEQVLNIAHHTFINTFSKHLRFSKPTPINRRKTKSVNETKGSPGFSRGGWLDGREGAVGCGPKAKSSICWSQGGSNGKGLAAPSPLTGIRSSRGGISGHTPGKPLGRKQLPVQGAVLARSLASVLHLLAEGVELLLLQFRHDTVEGVDLCGKADTRALKTQDATAHPQKWQLCFPGCFSPARGNETLPLDCWTGVPRRAHTGQWLLSSP